jgi:hypothetical protein
MDYILCTGYNPNKHPLILLLLPYVRTVGIVGRERTMEAYAGQDRRYKELRMISSSKAGASAGGSADEKRPLPPARGR